jgi:hypothetical protein
MKGPNREEQRRLIRQWEATGRELERIRRETLKDMPYNWVDVDALLELGASSPPTERGGSGLVEMQRYFMKAAPRT